MRNFVVYQTGSGARRIRRFGICPDSMFDAQGQVGETVLEADARDSTHYILDGAVAAKGDLSLTISPSSGQFVANGVAEVSISGIPAGTVVTWQGLWGAQQATINDGVFRLSTNIVGLYEIAIDPIAYKAQTVTVNAVPA